MHQQCTRNIAATCQEWFPELYSSNLSNCSLVIQRAYARVLVGSRATLRNELRDQTCRYSRYEFQDPASLCTGGRVKKGVVASSRRPSACCFYFRPRAAHPDRGSLSSHRGCRFIREIVPLDMESLDSQRSIAMVNGSQLDLTIPVDVNRHT